MEDTFTNADMETDGNSSSHWIWEKSLTDELRHSSGEVEFDSFMDTLENEDLKKNEGKGKSPHSESHQNNWEEDVQKEYDQDRNINSTMSQSRKTSSTKETVKASQKDTPAEYHIEGVLVWAKIRGYSYWPAIITVDPFDCVTMKGQESSKSKRKYHVHFLGYVDYRGWVPETGLLPFQGVEEYRSLAAKLGKGTKRKDYYPNKKFLTEFENGCRIADQVADFSYKERLEFLGLVYEPVPKKPEFKTPAEKKFFSERSVTNDEPSTKVHTATDLNNGLKVPTSSHKGHELASKPVVQTISKEHESDFVDMTHLDSTFSESESESEEFPPGTLVWGRMKGFPFWPSFIAVNPATNTYKKLVGKTWEYHVQFFNWNNEIGWVNKVMPWCPLQEFEKKASKVSKSKSSNWKDFRPQGKYLTSKWRNAYKEAVETVEMTRKERLRTFWADYPNRSWKKPHSKRNKAKKSFVMKSLPSNSIELPSGWSMSGSSMIESPHGIHFYNEQDLFGYLFRKNTPRKCLRKRSFSVCSGEICPSSTEGWLQNSLERLRNQPIKSQNFSSVSGTLDGSVQHFYDETLPEEWIVKHTYLDDSFEVTYHAPEGEVLRSKYAVFKASQGKLHPSQELEHFVEMLLKQRNNMVFSQKKSSKTKNRKRSKSKTFWTLDLSCEKAVEAYKKNRLVSRVFEECFVEVVKLPKVFLDHPSVSIIEVGNEMTISDLFTGKFIAKKIIYEQDDV